ERAQHGGAELLRMNARQRPLAGLADAPRRPAGVDDQCVSHGVVLFFECCWRFESGGTSSQLATSGRVAASPLRVHGRSRILRETENSERDWVLGSSRRVRSSRRYLGSREIGRSGFTTIPCGTRPGE